ncbi:unnamed protein product [Linum tenue]|uniref:Uncharacterized protein n=1 Tax=Linum tenue TaxID=586396 RepID=A0AAV0LNI7_9ROSI|nr:unnamed protein product [Linum tenue]
MGFGVSEGRGGFRLSNGSPTSPNYRFRTSPTRCHSSRLLLSHPSKLGVYFAAHVPGGKSSCRCTSNSWSWLRDGGNTIAIPSNEHCSIGDW